MPGAIFERFLSTPEMLGVWRTEAVVQAMLDFEAALARAQAASGVIPPAAGEAIAEACDAARFDLEAIVGASTSAGTLAIPLTKALTAEVAKQDAAAAGYVHWGSTSQDVIDTAMVLTTRRALALIDADLARLTEALFDVVQRHGDAPMLGRTLMQPALVISVGFKLVAWIAPLVRAREHLRLAANAALQLQLGGAVGTLSVMGDKGGDVAAHMAAELGLALPPGAWHTQRDAWVRLGCEVGVLCGSLGKIAADISLLAQAEIGEMSEPAAGAQGQKRGGSSAMPHKRNPVASMIALAAALRTPQRVAALLAAMPQQHERGLGNWQAELAEWPGLFISTHGALAALADAAAGLGIDEARMRANIDALHGLVFAEAASMLIARHIGKAGAHALLERLSRRVVAEQRGLLEITLEAVASDAQLAALIPADELRAVFDADAVARRASAIARPQLDALRHPAVHPNQSADHEST